MQPVKAKKSLGQHFLKDSEVARRIAATLCDYKPLPVLEVGGGTGMLTRALLEAGHNLWVVEVDASAVRYLQRHIPLPVERIIVGDFLRLDLSRLFPEPFCLIGNFPYHISSQIIFKALEHKDRIVCCAGMFQKEVAQRLAAPPGSRTYGIISVLLQAWYDVAYLFTVSERDFEPPPKVEGGVICARRNRRTTLGCDEKLFQTVVKTAFNQRRKTLRNSLKPLVGNHFPHERLPFSDQRPEQLSVEQFVALALLIEQSS